MTKSLEFWMFSNFLNFSIFTSLFHYWNIFITKEVDQIFAIFQVSSKKSNFFPNKNYEERFNLVFFKWKIFYSSIFFFIYFNYFILGCRILSFCNKKRLQFFFRFWIGTQSEKNSDKKNLEKDLNIHYRMEDRFFLLKNESGSHNFHKNNFWKWQKSNFISLFLIT